jgi:hypothetical protein
VFDLLRRHKAEIMLLLRPAGDGWSADDWQVFFAERAGIAEFDGGLPRVQAATRSWPFRRCTSTSRGRRRRTKTSRLSTLKFCGDGERCGKRIYGEPYSQRQMRSLRPERTRDYFEARQVFEHWN